MKPKDMLRRYWHIHGLQTHTAALFVVVVEIETLSLIQFDNCNLL